MRRLKSFIEVLTEDEILLIHNSSLEILEKVGMNVPNREVLQMCADLGAEVDFETETLRIPISLMEQVLDKMRRQSKNKPTDEPQKLSGHISTQVTIVDYMTGKRRYGLRDDNLKGIALVQHLDNIPNCNAVVVPSDVPYEISDVISFADIYKYSKKPGGTYILTPIGAKYISQINKMFGNKSSYLLETISPLSFKKDTVAMALQFAKEGGSLSIAPMVMGCATGPVTIAGTLTMENAEVLGSIFIVYVLTGKFPGYSASCHSIDPKTMLCSFGSPNQGLFAIAAAQMARYYGIQGGTNSALTDALVPDFQGGVEKGITAALNSLSGLWSIGCQGIVGADQGISLEQLVIDNEWMDYYNYILNGFEVSEDTIGLDTIKEVGIKGNFLAEEHTVRYMRESYWVSDIFNRSDWESWVAEGRKTVLERAHEYVESITAGYKDASPVISASMCDELDRIVKEAREEILSLNK